MVSVDKLERRLSGLILEGNSSEDTKWNELMRIRYKIRKLKETKPEVYALLLSRFKTSIDEIKLYLDKEW